MMSHSLIRLPPAHHSHPSPITHSLLHSRFKTHIFHKPFHHSLLAPTQDCLLAYLTRLTVLNGFFFILFIFFLFILGRAVDYAGLTASFRAHVKIASLHHIIDKLMLQNCLFYLRHKRALAAVCALLSAALVARTSSLTDLTVHRSG